MKKEEIMKKLEVTRKNFYQALRLCQEKDVKLYVQKCEYTLTDEFIVYTETWATNPNPTISHFLSDVSDEDFLVKLTKAIEMFWERIKQKNRYLDHNYNYAVDSPIETIGGNNEVS